jgi:hypothetical protein
MIFDAGCPVVQPGELDQVRSATSPYQTITMQAECMILNADQIPDRRALSDACTEGPAATMLIASGA